MNMIKTIGEIEDLYVCLNEEFELLKFPSYGIIKKKIKTDKKYLIYRK